MPAPLLLTQAAASVLAGALVVKAIIEDRDMAAGASTGSNSSRFRATTKPPCPTCNGRRQVPCFCSRWSDGDVGCRTCSGSGMALCNTCHGSGTARPIPVSLKASSSPPRHR